MPGISPNGSAVDRRPSIANDHCLAFGEFLRQAREHRGVTLEQIARETKIPSWHLDALEHGELAAVPGGVYRRAEVRAYAQVVGLDQRVALEQLEHALEVPGQGPQAVATPPSRRAPSARLIAIAAIAIGLTASIAYVVWTRAAVDRAAAGTAVAVQSIDGAGATASAAAPAAPQSSERNDAPAGTLEQAQPAAAVDATAKPVPPAAADGTLIVTTEPEGARVTVNGIGRGVTPLTVSYLPFGDVRVRISKDGYRSEERVVQFEPQRAAISMHVTMGANVTAAPPR
jgi:cytoskeleton protein RodZ